MGDDGVEVGDDVGVEMGDRATCAPSSVVRHSSRARRPTKCLIDEI